MSDFDAQVQKIIDDEFRTIPAQSDMCCGTSAIAFRHLQARRQVPGQSLDMPLAAAEHYMFAKVMVCGGTVGAKQMTVLVIMYDVKKLLDKWTGTPNTEQVTSNPVSPPSLDVVKWGLKGVFDGSILHSACNPNTVPPLWTNLEQVFGPGKGLTVAGKQY